LEYPEKEKIETKNMTIVILKSIGLIIGVLIVGLFVWQVSGNLKEKAKRAYHSGQTARAERLNFISTFMIVALIVAVFLAVLYVF
jgi:ABC-type nickel/cobalt efflux system permease component RcnA